VVLNFDRAGQSEYFDRGWSSPRACCKK
jgi:hypothetical protein